MTLKRGVRERRATVTTFRRMVARATGRWQIVEMDLWDRDAIDLLGPGFVEIAADGTGHFRFIAVEGDIDGRHVERDGRPAVEFSWVGTDDSDDASGRGWGLVDTDGSLVGHIHFHHGDDSGFRAVVWHSPE
jgi:hypothetical protein